MKKIAINGFGRIGRHVFKVALENPNLEVVAINDLVSNDLLAHLLKYDSSYGRFEGEVSHDDEHLIVNGKKIKSFAEKYPENLPWKELKIDTVIESTGIFRTKEGAEKHIQAGAKKVLISAPAKNEIDATIVFGVNENVLSPQDKIVSNASCTTNCLAPVAKVLHDKFIIKKGLMTTVHAYTNDQKILDLPHKDWRRSRAAGLSIIPTTTGAAKAVAEVIPDLKGKLNGMAMRVPTPTVSIVDLVVELEKKTSPEEVNEALRKRSEEIPHVLAYTEEPLVSMDFKGDPRSSIVDGLSTMMVGDNLLKIVSWYDNEWGYSNRTVELAALM